jgi:hypothetical protein
VLFVSENTVARTSNNAYSLKAVNVQVDGASEATVDSIGPLNLVRAVGASVVNIKAPSIKEININDSSKLLHEGNIFGGSVDGGSSVKVTGSVEGGFLELDGGSTINRIPVMAPILAPLLGFLFLRGHISLKNWSYRPILRASTSPFKSTCLLIRLKEVPDALYGPHLCR